jgi:hypothetical protein
MQSLKAVPMNSAIFWVVTPRSSLNWTVLELHYIVMDGACAGRQFSCMGGTVESDPSDCRYEKTFHFAAGS